MRSFSQPTYGIAPEQVIRSGCKLRFEMVAGKPLILRLPEIYLVGAWMIEMASLV